MYSNEWRPGVSEKLGFYVYLLIDPRDGDIFYVGKGVEGRCFSHIAEARTTRRDERRGYAKLRRIRDIERQDSTVRIDIVRGGLSESEALLVEGAAIDLLGLDTLANRVHGHGAGRETVDDVNARLGAVPAVFTDADNFLLIRVSRQFHNDMTPDELYEATRKYWKLGPRRSKATHALAVHAGVVRGAFKIDDWYQPDDAVTAADKRHVGRWAFLGSPDPEMLSRFLFCDVTAQFSQGNQNPVTYVGC